MRASFASQSSRKAGPRVFVSVPPNSGSPAEVGVHVPSGTLWLSIDEAEKLATDLSIAADKASRRQGS